MYCKMCAIAKDFSVTQKAFDIFTLRADEQCAKIHVFNSVLEMTNHYSYYMGPTQNVRTHY
jgi:hypothetical protein